MPGRIGRLYGPTFDPWVDERFGSRGVCGRQDACSGEDIEVRTGSQNVAQILAEVTLEDQGSSENMSERAGVLADWMEMFSAPGFLT